MPMYKFNLPGEQFDETICVGPEEARVVAERECHTLAQVFEAADQGTYAEANSIRIIFFGDCRDLSTIGDYWDLSDSRHITPAE